MNTTYLPEINSILLPTGCIRYHWIKQSDTFGAVLVRRIICKHEPKLSRPSNSYMQSMFSLGDFRIASCGKEKWKRFTKIILCNKSMPFKINFEKNRTSMIKCRKVKKVNWNFWVSIPLCEAGQKVKPSQQTEPVVLESHFPCPSPVKVFHYQIENKKYTNNHLSKSEIKLEVSLIFRKHKKNKSLKWSKYNSKYACPRMVWERRTTISENNELRRQDDFCI